MNFTCIVRSANERTAENCRKLLEMQLGGAKLFVVSKRPFAEAVRETFRIGIEEDKEWTLAVDGDILPRSNFIKSLLDIAKGAPRDILSIKAAVFDSLWGMNRESGHHLYRTEHLLRANELIMPANQVIQPERHIKKRLVNEGFNVIKVTEPVIALHDAEQYFVDIYRKALLYSFKHLSNSKYYIPRWRKQKEINPDCRVAIRAFADGIANWTDISMDRNLFPKEIHSLLDQLGLKEKEPMKEFSFDDVEKLL